MDTNNQQKAKAAATGDRASLNNGSLLGIEQNIKGTSAEIIQASSTNGSDLDVLADLATMGDRVPLTNGSDPESKENQEGTSAKIIKDSSTDGFDPESETKTDVNDKQNQQGTSAEASQTNGSDHKSEKKTEFDDKQNQHGTRSAETILEQQSVIPSESRGTGHGQGQELSETATVTFSDSGSKLTGHGREEETSDTVAVTLSDSERTKDVQGPEQSNTDADCDYTRENCDGKDENYGGLRMPIREETELFDSLLEILKDPTTTPESLFFKEGDSKDVQTLKDRYKEETNNWKSMESQIYDRRISDILEMYENIYTTFKQELKSKQNTTENTGGGIEVDTELDAKNVQNYLKHMSTHLSDDAFECADTIHALFFSEEHGEIDDVELLTIEYTKQYNQLKKLYIEMKDKQISDIIQRYTRAFHIEEERVKVEQRERPKS